MFASAMNESSAIREIFESACSSVNRYPAGGLDWFSNAEHDFAA
jgi:hypothetical protein